jgi:hypothetical protein
MDLGSHGLVKKKFIKVEEKANIYWDPIKRETNRWLHRGAWL